MAKFSVQFDAIEERMVAAAVSAIDAATEEIKREIDANTPEKTGKLLANNVRESANLVWSKVIGKVSNSTEYALYVEYGLWRKLNYHKPIWTVFRTAVGARMFTRAKDKLGRKIARDFAATVAKSLWNR